MARPRINDEQAAGTAFLAAVERACIVPGEHFTQQRLAAISGVSRQTIRTRIDDPMQFTIRELRSLVSAGLPADDILAVCGCRPRKPASDAAHIEALLRQIIQEVHRND